MIFGTIQMQSLYPPATVARVNAARALMNPPGTPMPAGGGFVCEPDGTRWTFSIAIGHENDFAAGDFVAFELAQGTKAKYATGDESAYFRSP